MNNAPTAPATIAADEIALYTVEYSDDVTGAVHSLDIFAVCPDQAMDDIQSYVGDRFTVDCATPASLDDYFTG